MPWVTFTADDVKARLAARELEVYEETARREYPEEGGEAEVPPDGPDRLEQIVRQVLGQFRGAIQANPFVATQGPEGTLPEACIAYAAVVARVALVGMNPVPEGMTDPRMEEYREAMRFLRDLRTAPASMFEDAGPTAAGGSSFGGNPQLDF